MKSLRLAIAVVCTLLVPNLLSAQVAALGDVYVGTCDGTQANTQLNETAIYTPAGTLRTTFHGPVQNACTTAMTFDSKGNLRVISAKFGTQSWQVLEFDNSGGLKSNLGPFTGPVSVTHDQQGNIYLGIGNIVKIAPNGATTTYPAAGSALWVSMAPDQHTIFYSAANGDVKSFDTATSTQGPDIAPGAMATTVRSLPDSSILVDSLGAIIHWVPGCNGCPYHDVFAYQIPANADGFALDPDGASFWTINTFYDTVNQLGKGTVYRTNIATGDAMGSFALQPLGSGRYYSKGIGVNGDGTGSTLTFAPSSLTFPARAIGTSGSAKKVTLTNTGAVQIVISKLTVTSDFAVKQNLCAKGINPGASCTISVVFAPTGVGTRTGSLKIFDNAPTSPQTVNLSGTGLGATATSLTSSLNPSTYGQDVVFTARVTTNGSSAPTGTVTFFNGTQSMGKGTVSGGVATLTKSNIDVGTISVKARYNGDSLNAKSTSPAINQTVTKANTTTTVVSSKNPSKVGNSVKFTATVQSIATPTGSVTFMAGTTNLGTVTLAGGHASVTTATLPAGTTTVTATYNGTSNFNGSSGSVIQTVN